MQQSRAKAVAAMNQAFAEVEGEVDRIVGNIKARSAEVGWREARSEYYFKLQMLDANTLHAVTAVTLARLADKEGA